MAMASDLRKRLGLGDQAVQISNHGFANQLVVLDRVKCERFGSFAASRSTRTARPQLCATMTSTVSSLSRMTMKLLVGLANSSDGFLLTVLRSLQLGQRQLDEHMAS